QIAAALWTESCWPQTTLASPAKPVGLTRGKTIPTFSRIITSCGTRPASASRCQATPFSVSMRGDETGAPMLGDDIMSKKPLLRFAPSPNGRLHLGHALSALVTWRAAEQLG